MRSDSGEVAFPFQSFPDNGESAAGRMSATVHPPSGSHVEFNHGGYIGSEFVNRSSCPPSVPMSGNVDRVYEFDGDQLHLAPVRWMKTVTDKLDVL